MRGVLAERRGKGLLKWVLLSAIGVFCLVLIFRFPFYYNLFKPRKKANPSFYQMVTSTVIPTRPQAVTGPAHSVTSSRKIKDWGRDPFSEALHEPSSFEGSTLSLTGILYHGQRKVAILNHTLVREGDTIRDFQVIHIEKDSVILKQGEKKITVRLGGP